MDSPQKDALPPSFSLISGSRHIVNRHPNSHRMTVSPAPPRKPYGMSPSTSIDPLAATTTDLQQALAEGLLTSTRLVALYLAQIDQYEPLLNAFIAVAPREMLTEAAANLDRERAQGRLRGPLHGIPIVLKVGQAASLVQRSLEHA